MRHKVYSALASIVFVVLMLISVFEVPEKQAPVFALAVCAFYLKLRAVEELVEDLHKRLFRAQKNSRGRRV